MAVNHAYPTGGLPEGFIDKLTSVPHRRRKAMTLLTVATRLVLTGAVAATLALAQAPQAFANCGNPAAHEAMRGLNALKHDAHFTSPAARAKIQYLEAQLRLAIQRWIEALKIESGGVPNSANQHPQSVGINNEIHALLDQIKHAQAQGSFGA
jgi:hypothetical protein